MENAGPYIKKFEDWVHLISPTFGSTLKIWKPKAKIGSSKTALKDLIHIEKQVETLSGMPDFGYAEDNYILQESDQDKWKHLTGIIGDNSKFEWLMGYIRMTQLEEMVKKNDEAELIAR